MKNNLTIKLSLLILVIFFSTSTLIINENKAHQNDLEKYMRLNYTTSNPITIMNDTALAFYASSGDGSVGTPYIIENLNITTTNLTAIHIEFTTVHFIIQDCLLIADQDALSLDSISSNTFEISNNILSASRSGIFITDSDYSNITHNVCYGSTNALYFFNSNYLFLENNTCYGNVNGMYTDSCDYLTVYDSKFHSNSQHGIYVSTNSNFVNITYCYFHSNTKHGIYLSNSISSSITHNECYSNGYYGLLLHTGSMNTVEFNYVHDNSRDGIRVWQSDLNDIFNNTIEDNAWHGINNLYSTRTSIEDNVAIEDGFAILSSSQGDQDQLSIGTNTVNGKPLGYINGLGETTIASGVYGQIILAFCNGTVIRDETISNTSIAVQIMGSHNITVDNCNLDSNNYGSIEIRSSIEVTVKNTKSSNNEVYGGIYDLDTINTTLINCTTNNNQFGIYFLSSSGFNVTNCTVYSNSWYNTRFQNGGFGNITYNEFSHCPNEGMLLFNCDYTTINHNVFENNADYAIFAQGCMNNWIHHNALVNNKGGLTQAYDDSTLNLWEFNYWSDWSGTGNYTLDAGVKVNDTSPLGDYPVGIFEFSDSTYIILMIPVTLVIVVIYEKRKK